MLAKTKLKRVEVLISEALIDSRINHDKFFSVNGTLKIWRFERRSALGINKDLSSYWKTLI